MHIRRLLLFTVALTPVFVASAAAQQIHVQSPLVTVSDGFYEYSGVHWGFWRRGPRGYVFFDNGGAMNLPPGGGVFATPAHFGFAHRAPHGGGFFRLYGGQGSYRSVTGQTASLTLTNGVPGYLFHGTWRPFVTGWVPVVGDAPFWPQGGALPPGATPYAPRIPQAWEHVVQDLRPSADPTAVQLPETPRPPARREDFVDEPLILRRTADSPPESPR